MPIIRKQLKPSDVYPEDIRYNEATDTVQSFINGEWVDNPEADPRHQTTFPPRITADPACDAAESIKDALKGQIDAILVAIDNASTAFAIGGLILGLFSFGVFAIFIALALAIADQMIAAGSTALNAALTDPVYHTFVCILQCEMDANGRLTEEDLPAIMSQIDDQIGGLGAIILNAMVSLAGEGGLNNLASLGTSTGDCDDCGCAEPCPDADSFYNGTVNSITDNGDGTITFNVTSVPAIDGTEYIGWGDRGNSASPCCVFISQDAFSGSALGGAVQGCGSGTEFAVPPLTENCYHFFLFYGNFALTTPFTCDVVFSSACP